MLNSALAKSLAEMDTMLCMCVAPLETSHESMLLYVLPGVRSL